MRAMLCFIFLAACSPYSPNIGNTPFLCGTGMPACPDGYACTGNTGSGMAVCQKKGGGTMPDSSLNGMCADDTSLGANHSTSMAFPLPMPLPDTTNCTPQPCESMTLGPLSICPVDDKDFFSIMLTHSPSQMLEVDLTYDAWGAPLTGGILNSGGTPIVNFSPVSGSPMMLKAVDASLPPDTYFIEVYATQTAPMINNYHLTVTASPYP